MTNTSPEDKKDSGRPIQQDSFTRLVYAYVQAPEDSWDPTPVVDLNELDLSTCQCPGRQGTAPKAVWEALEEEELRQRTTGMVTPIQDYLAGIGYDRPLVRAFRWTNDARQRVGQKLRFDLPDGRTVRFRIADVEWFLFDTGVGLVAVEVMLDTVVTDGKPLPPCLEDLVEVHATLRALQKREAVGICREASPSPNGPGPSDPETPAAPSPRSLPERIRAGQEFRLLEMIDWCLSPLDEAIRQRGGRRIAMNAGDLLGFVYGRIPPGPTGSPIPCAEVGEDLFRLRRGYKGVYHPSKALRQTEDHQEVYHPFDGVVHGISIEGAAILLLDDGKTPFFDEFQDRVRRRYFTLFLMALHQRVALERLSTCSARFPRLHPDSKHPKDLLKAARHLREAAFNFTLHHTFVWVGAVTMYQEVYERMRSVMRVPALHEDLRDDLLELDELMERKDREDREAAEREVSKRHKTIETAIAVLFPVTLLLAAWGTNFRELVTDAQSAVGLWDPPAVTSYAITLGLIAGMLTWIWWPRNRRSPD